MENISDEQIRDAIKQLNEDYSATNEDFVMTVAPFDAIAADMDIEFRLAGKDNEGNCTKGITRTYSTLTYGGGGGSVAALVEGAQGLWPQNKYMNVYVQADLGGPAGESGVDEPGGTSGLAQAKQGFQDLDFGFLQTHLLDALVQRNSIMIP